MSHKNSKSSNFGMKLSSSTSNIHHKNEKPIEFSPKFHPEKDSLNISCPQIHIKIDKKQNIKKDNRYRGRSFIYKQVNVHGPQEISSRKKLIKLNDTYSGGSITKFLEKSAPYIVNPRSISPLNQINSNNNSSYRIIFPDLNCETPKFHGIKTFHDPYVVSPINFQIIGKKKENKENFFVEKKIKNERKNVGETTFENNEKKIGKKIINETEKNKKIEKEGTLKQIINWEFGKAIKINENRNFEKNDNVKNNLNKKNNDEFIFKYDEETLKKKIYRNSHLKDTLGKDMSPNNSMNQPKKIKYPNQKRIFEGDYKFWKDFADEKKEPGFKLNNSKVNYVKYKDYVDHIKKEKNNLEKYFEKQELELDNFNQNIKSFAGKKQFPNSITFKTHIKFG